MPNSRRWTYWTVRFSTAEYAGYFDTRKEAQTYADGVNRYMMARQGEYGAVAIVRVVDGEETAEYPAHD